MVGGWWLVVGGWWLMAAGWWLVAGGGWWLLAGGGCSLTLSLAGLICSPLLLLALLLAHRSLSLSLSLSPLPPDGAYATLDSRTPAYAELAPHHHALYTATGGAAGGTGTGRGTTGTSARPAYNQLAEDGVYGAAEHANYDTSNPGDTGVYAALDRNSSSL